jgi:ketosteroid isomerase-like protein
MRPTAQGRVSAPPRMPRFRGIRGLRAILCAGLLVFASGGSAQAIPHQQHHTPKTVRRTIATLEQRWTAAELSGDASTINSMLAEDYLGIAPDGTLDSKADTLRAIRNGAIHFTSITASMHKLRVYGSTAVVISTAEVSGTYDGHSINGRYRYTRVYHLDGATWKIVSFEASRIREHGHAKSQDLAAQS